MRITLDLPDNVSRIMYAVSDENGYESEPKNVTLGMYVKVGTKCDGNRLLELGQELPFYLNASTGSTGDITARNDG